MRDVATQRRDGPTCDSARAKRIRARLREKYPDIEPITNYAGIANAWLLPDGRLYSCSYHGHLQLTERICKSVWLPDLENDWVKLSDNEWQGPYLITQKQLDVIWDWCQINGKSFDSTMYDII